MNLKIFKSNKRKKKANNQVYLELLTVPQVQLKIYLGPFSIHWSASLNFLKNIITSLLIESYICKITNNLYS